MSRRRPSPSSRTQPPRPAAMRDRSRERERDRDRDRDRDRNRDRDHDRRPANDIPRFTGREDSRVADHEFTFEHPRQPPMDSYRPGQDDHQRSRAPPTGPRRGGHGGARGGSGNIGGRGGYDRGGRGGRDGKPFVYNPPVPAHERPILYFDTRGKTPELMEGMAPGNGDRFKEDPEEQDEEVDVDVGEDREKDAPMEISDNEGETGEAGEKAKKVDAEGETKPEKKPDVFSMIRAFKAKTAATQRNAVADNDDFIPLSFDNDINKAESEPEPEPEQGRKMRRANDGHRIVENYGRERNSNPKTSPNGGFSHRDQHYQRVEERQPVRDVGPPGAASIGPSAASLPPPPPLGSTIKFNLGDKAKEIAAGGPSKPAQSFNKGGDIPWPPPPPPMDILPPPPPPPPSRPLTHLDLPRKRKFEDFTGRRGTQHLDGNIQPKYQIPRGIKIDPVPWVKLGGDHSRCFDMGDWLHKEITDFISFIQPHAYEHAVRRELIYRVRKIVDQLWPDTDVRVFGSFAAELYLPTSDIDLVIISENYAHYDIPKYSNRKSLLALASRLQSARICVRPPQVVLGAKVPIIKFVDATTGISVDISFENASGMVANETFQKWKKKYPAMPILVLLIKHFLSMRGLNEPYAGGLGSFSVTCMVISLLQLLPSVRSGLVDPRLHLGVMLLEFLELYGKNFNTDTVGIRVDEEAPGYFNKKGLFNSKMGKEYQLVIQDPNNPENDISKASFAIKLILSTFADAYDALLRQMAMLDKLPFAERVSRSILGVIIGGDYSEVDKQRTVMKNIYDKIVGDKDASEWMKKDGEKEKRSAETRKVDPAKAKREGPRERKGNGGPKGKAVDAGEDEARKGKGKNRPRGEKSRTKRGDSEAPKGETARHGPVMAKSLGARSAAMVGKEAEIIVID